MSYLRPRVITDADAKRLRVRGAGSPPADPYLAKLIKYIPGESIATYQAIVGFVPADRQAGAMPWVAIIILILTPLWMYFATRVETDPPQWFQTLISPIAFAVWLVALNSPIVMWVIGHPVETWIGSALLVAATAVIPLLEKIFVK